MNEIEAQTDRRRNGNVAQLPRAVRERINVMLEDGVTYEKIIEKLGEDGKGLSKSNLSRWKQGGYQDWVLRRDWLESTRARQEPASDLSVDYDATELNHGALQLGTLAIFEALKELGEEGGRGRAQQPEGKENHDQAEEVDREDEKERKGRSKLDEKLGGDSSAFVRLMNALARVSRETMLVQRYREACAKARLALQPLQDPNRELTLQERRALVREVDKILGLDSQEFRLQPGKYGLVSCKLGERKNEDQKTHATEGTNGTNGADAADGINTISGGHDEGKELKIN